jgi:hypothetical protein
MQSGMKNGMIGAIVGDITGSRFEWHNRKTKRFMFHDDYLLKGLYDFERTFALNFGSLRKELDI